MEYVVIMAGGIGSRFWPASRTKKPKQFHDILGVGKSLIRLTFERFTQLVPPQRIYVITNEQYAGLVLQELPELSEAQVLGEPSRNNTAPSVAWASFHLHSFDPEANVVVAPSDHIILREEAFIGHLRKALQFTARESALCTLGITPTRPDTGYGYIHFGQATDGGIHKVIEFVEKPDAATATQYLAAGDYLWNAGIFIWRTSAILQAFEEHAPDIYHLFEKGKAFFGKPEEKQFIRDQYPLSPSISVDYAILEKAQNVYTIPADIGWSDLGTWASLHEESPKDASGNVLQGQYILAYETKDSLIRATDEKLVVVNGLENYIVVDNDDVLLIWPKDKEQEIKKLTSLLNERFGERYS